MKGEMTQKGKEALERFKMESASEVGVNLKDGYNGDLTSREGSEDDQQLQDAVVQLLMQNGTS